MYLEGNVFLKRGFPSYFTSLFYIIPLIDLQKQVVLKLVDNFNQSGIISAYYAGGRVPGLSKLRQRTRRAFFFGAPIF